MEILCIKFIPNIHCILNGFSTLANKLYTGFPQLAVDKRTLVPLLNVCYDRFKENKGKGVASMAMLTDEMLLDSYHTAVQLMLDRDFIALLLAEIHKRELETSPAELVH